jgi:putative redox protein
VEANVKWVDGLRFVGCSGSGHSLVMDGNAGDSAASPMELVLLAAGGCSSVDVVSILQKGRQQIRGCEVRLQAERAPDVPRVFTRLHLHFIVTGKALKEKQVERAVALSMEKYCSVSSMLAKSAELSHSFEIVALA